MLILLPPSETKRPGGGGLSLRETGLSGLAFTEQTPQRHSLMDALTELSGDGTLSARILKLGPKQLAETAVNAQVWDSPTMTAIERFTGVLFDAIEVDALPPRARTFLNDHVLISSALFGLIRASDQIPAYRLSYNTRLPGVDPLAKVWAQVGTSVLEDLLSGGRPHHLILDLRSEGYAALSPLPKHEGAFFVRAVGRSRDGEIRQLNHFNKKGKGVFLNKLAHSFPLRAEPTLDDVLSWAAETGVELSRTQDPHTVQLVINEADYPPISAR